MCVNLCILVVIFQAGCLISDAEPGGASGSWSVFEGEGEKFVVEIELCAICSAYGCVSSLFVVFRNVSDKKC